MQAGHTSTRLRRLCWRTKPLWPARRPWRLRVCQPYGLAALCCWPRLSRHAQLVCARAATAGRSAAAHRRQAHALGPWILWHWQVHLANCPTSMEYSYSTGTYLARYSYTGLGRQGIRSTRTQGTSTGTVEPYSYWNATRAPSARQAGRESLTAERGGGDLHLLGGLMRNHLEVRLGVAFRLLLPEHRCWLTY